MTIEELKAACESTVSAGGEIIMLAVPLTSRGYTQRLCGNEGPRGEIVCAKADDYAVCRFKAKAVLKFIKARGLRDVE